MSNYKERNKKIFELFFIIALIGVSAYMIYIAQTTGKPGQNGQLSSMAFPKAAYIGIIAMCVYLLADNIRWLIKHPVDKNSPKAPYVPFKSLVTFVHSSFQKSCYVLCSINVIQCTLSKTF